MKPRPFSLVTLLVATLGLGCTAQAWGSKRLPSWAEAVVDQAGPAKPEDDATALYHSVGYDMSKYGTLVRTVRYVLRIEKTAGRQYAYLDQYLDPESDKLLSVNAWSVGLDQTVETFDKHDLEEREADPSALYTEGKILSIDARAKTPVGGIFVYEFALRSRSQFAQERAVLNIELPTQNAVISATFGPGWNVSSRSFGREPTDAYVEGDTYFWTYRDVPGYEEETYGPELAQMLTGVGIDFLPPENARSLAADIQTFRTWNDVSRYLAQLHSPRVLVDEFVQAKAQEVTAGAIEPRQKLRNLAVVAQKVNYAAIAMGLGQGGGYRPHDSITTLRRNFGDCKDKTNLLRALLRVVGVESFPVIIWSGPHDLVDPTWPSPGAFNHCIIAIRVANDFEAPAIADHPRLGRLLFFDPTEERVPFGHLPEYLEGNWALIGDPGEDALIRMPVAPTGSHRLERTIMAELDEHGNLRAGITEISHGAAATRERRSYARNSPQEYRDVVNHWIAGTAGLSQLDKLEVTDDFEGNQFTSHITYAAPKYARAIRNRLLIVKPALVGRQHSALFTEATRAQPIFLPTCTLDENYTIQLPHGWVVDELPAPVNLACEFGEFRLDSVVVENELHVVRYFSLHRSTLPPERYAEVKAF